MSFVFLAPCSVQFRKQRNVGMISSLWLTRGPMLWVAALPRKRDELAPSHGFPRLEDHAGRISHFEIEDCAVGHTKRVAAHVRWVKSGHQLSALGCPLMRHPLSEVCPALTASTTM